MIWWLFLFFIVKFATKQLNWYCYGMPTVDLFWWQTFLAATHANFNFIILNDAYFFSSFKSNSCFPRFQFKPIDRTCDCVYSNECLIEANAKRKKLCACVCFEWNLVLILLKSPLSNVLLVGFESTWSQSCDIILRRLFISTQHSQNTYLHSIVSVVFCFSAFFFFEFI